MAQAMNHNVDPTFRTILSRHAPDECNVVSVNSTSPEWFTVDVEGVVGKVLIGKMERAGYHLINIYTPEYPTADESTRLQFRKK